MQASEVIKKYVSGEKDKHGRFEWSTSGRGRVSSAYIEQIEGRAILLNYGSHFPLTVYCGEKKIDGKKTKIFVKNGDTDRRHSGWGPSTSTLQGNVQRLCYGPTVSASGLAAAGINFAALRIKGCADAVSGVRPVILDFQSDTVVVSGMWPVILDFQADTRIDSVRLYKDPETGAVTYKKGKTTYLVGDQTFDDVYVACAAATNQSTYGPDSAVASQQIYEPWTPPKVGMFIATGICDTTNSEPVDGSAYGHWHILGASLICQRKRYFLCALDERRYFVSELAKPCKTCTEAFEQLKPDAVKLAEQAGLRVRRQGEWFFIPTSHDTQSMAAMFDLSRTKFFRERTEIRSIPDPAGRFKTNTHVARLCVDATGSVVYATGKVFHKDRWGSSVTHEHATLDLGTQWYHVVHNTEKNAWSMTGSFD